MKLSDFDQLQQLQVERSNIIADIQALAQDDWGGSIRGQRFDPAVRALLAPVIRHEAAARLATVSRKMRALGVEIDGPEYVMMSAFPQVEQGLEWPDDR